MVRSRFVGVMGGGCASRLIVRQSEKFVEAEKKSAATSQKGLGLLAQDVGGALFLRAEMREWQGKFCLVPWASAVWVTWDEWEVSQVASIEPRRDLSYGGEICRFLPSSIDFEKHPTQR